MAFYVIVVTFLVTLCMNKFTYIVIPTYFQFIQMPIIETNFGMICIQAILWWNIVMDDWNANEKSLSKWPYLQHCKSIMPKYVNKEWQILLG